MILHRSCKPDRLVEFLQPGGKFLEPFGLVVGINHEMLAAGFVPRRTGQSRSDNRQGGRTEAKQQPHNHLPPKIPERIRLAIARNGARVVSHFPNYLFPWLAAIE